jgi:hypothetical protein
MSARLPVPARMGVKSRMPCSPLLRKPQCALLALATDRYSNRCFLMQPSALEVQRHDQLVGGPEVPPVRPQLQRRRRRLRTVLAAFAVFHLVRVGVTKILLSGPRKHRHPHSQPPGVDSRVTQEMSVAGKAVRNDVTEVRTLARREERLQLKAQVGTEHLDRPTVPPPRPWARNA